MCRDGFHMSVPYGRYLLACVWMKTLFSGRASENPYVPETEEGILDSEKAHSIPCILGATANDIPRGGDPDGLMKTCVGFAERTGRIGSAPNYLYSFRRRLPGDEAGAFHSADLWYLFGTLGRSWRPFEERDRELSRRICDCWCSFFRTGDPGWKPYTDQERFIEVFE